MNNREASRKEWRVEDFMGKATRAEIDSGSLQRIADATEKMAANYDALRAERDRFERWYKEERERKERAQRSNIALRGVITRLRRKAG